MLVICLPEVLQDNANHMVSDWGSSGRRVKSAERQPCQPQLRGIAGAPTSRPLQAASPNPRCAKSVPRQADTARHSADMAKTKYQLSWAFVDTVALGKTR